MRRAPDARGSQPRAPSACHMRPVTAITARCTVHCSCTAASSGLFIPMKQLPDIVQKVAPYLPTYRYGQLAWNAIGFDIKEPLGAPALWLLGYGIVFVVIAVRAYRREDRKTFG